MLKKYINTAKGSATFDTKKNIWVRFLLSKCRKVSLLDKKKSLFFLLSTV